MAKRRTRRKRRKSRRRKTKRRKTRRRKKRRKTKRRRRGGDWGFGGPSRKDRAISAHNQRAASIRANRLAKGKRMRADAAASSAAAASKRREDAARRAKYAANTAAADAKALERRKKRASRSGMTKVASGEACRNINDGDIKGCGKYYYFHPDDGFNYYCRNPAVGSQCSPVSGVFGSRKRKA